MADKEKTVPETPAPPAPVAPSIEGPGKGKAFFDRAKTVAATGNFDYAIDMMIEGLNREPNNVEEHKYLREVGIRRKVAGGKPAGGLMGPKLPYKGKVPKEAMLNAEFILAKDVGNIPSMLTIMRNAALCDYRETVNWIGPMLQEANRTTKTPKLDIYIELKETYKKFREFLRAVEALRFAIDMKPTDGDLQSQLMELAAMETLERGKYEQSDSFTDSIRDKEGTKALLEQENLNKSKEYLDKVVESSKEAYEKNPQDPQLINKYYKALVETDDEEFENRAVEILKKAYEDTKIYRFKFAIGDVKIKQFNRNIRMLMEAAKADPADKETLKQLDVLGKERLAYELEEYRERSENFPTDMQVRYEFGRRLYYSGHYDEAIGALQEAQTSPKNRVDSLHLLGRSFMTQKMIPEALDTFKRSIEEYDLAQTGDKKSKNLHYWYARALEENGNTVEAVDMYSKIVRWDIGFLDARKRLNELRGKLPPTN